MTDLIVLTGPLVHHESATPLPKIEVVARPSRVVSRTSDGEDALKVPSTETDETGEFFLELVHSPGLRYYIEYHYGKRVVTPYVLDCDSWPAGSTVTITDLPPIAGVPPSAVEDLQAWLLARLAALFGGGVTAIVALTQEDYDLLDPPDESTLYVITD